MSFIVKLPMRNCKVGLISALFVLLLFPTTASADSFNQNNGLYFSAKGGLYRQKTTNRPWQLISLPNQAVIKQSVSFDDQIWLVVEMGSKQYLYRQNNPLNFSVVEKIIPATEISLKLTKNNLVVFRRKDADVGLSVFRSGDQFESIEPPLVTSSQDLARFVELNNTLLFLQPTSEKVSIYQYSHSRQLVLTTPCAELSLFESPTLGFHCLDGTIFQAEASDRWVKLNLASVKKPTMSDQLLVGWDKVDDNLIHIWQGGTVSTIRLPSTNSAEEASQVIVKGERILLKKINGNWLELDWQTEAPKLIELTDTSSGEVVPIGDSESLLISGLKPQLSTEIGQWQLITTVGAFSNAHQTPLGLLIWNNGSLTQFASNGSTAFKKVNPWSSTTSPIQAFEIGPTTSFVSVVTQSGTGNANLYKTTDYLNWSRVTLPSKPTLSPTINQARQLVAGSLVELSGVITVGPKVVDSEVLYLEDASSGIQVYLNQTNGALPTKTKINAVVSGEISSSQTRRVILGSVADLELGNLTNWSLPIVEPDQANNFIGRSVQLKGGVVTANTDDLYFHRLTDPLKLHYVGAKALFRPDDQLIVPAVIDWNSASGKNEAWALSADYQLISRQELANSVVATVPVSQTVPTTLIQKSITPKKQISITPAKTTLSPTPSSVNLSAPPVAPIIVAGVQASQTDDGTNSQQTISLGLISLVTGLLSFRGRRFRHLLAD